MRMNVEVKWLDYVDELPSDFDGPCMLAMTSGIGEVGSDAADNFQVVVCNPAWVAQKLDEDGIFWPRGYLIVRTIEPDSVRHELQRLVDSLIKDGGWTVFAGRLNRWLLWEFEDYQQYQPRS